MAFTVNPAEAQAMQEDEAQLLLAITQATRSAAALINQPQPAATEAPDTLRIQMGRRLVYGPLAQGQFRNELNADRLKAIFDAIQRPVTEGMQAEKYRGKIPAIQISDGNTVLFREERDGTVTVNQIQFQLEQRTPEPSPQLAGNGRSPTIGARPAEQTPSVVNQEPAIAQDMDWKADDLAQVAEYLLNPLGDNSPMYDAVSIQGYQIAHNGDNLQVTREDVLVLQASNGKVLEQNIEQRDWEAFQGMMLRPVSWNGQQPSQASDELSAAVNGRGAASHPAITVAAQQLARLPEGATKQLLTATLQDWQQQVSQGLQQGVSWLVALPEVWRSHQVAQAALVLFQRGYERTGEKSYQAGDYTISLRGQNLYSLHDHSGELLQFKTAKPLLYQHRVQLVATSDRLGASHQKQLQKMQRNALFTPHGSLGIETVYTTKTSKVEQTVKDFLRNHVGANVWNKEGGRFKLEMGEDFLRITDKQGGRGTIFQRKDGKVFSRLGSGDFKHFERLANRMQRLEHQQSKAETSAGQHSSVEIG